MKKKIVSICTLLTLLAVFFVVPVHAENTYVRELRSYSNSISAVSLTYSVTAAQFGYVTESTLSGGMHSPILVTARITNNGTQDVKIANSYIDLTFTTYSQVSAFDCYSSDLMVQMVKNGNDTPRYNIVASNGYSYGGHVVVPALSSLYLVFEVDIEASFDTSTASVTSPALDAILFSINSSDVVAGDYPTTGSVPEQLSNVEDTLYDLYSEQSLTRQQLISFYNDVHTLLLAIKNQIVSSHTFSLDRLTSSTLTGRYPTVTVGNSSYYVVYNVSSLVPVSTAVAIDGLSGQDLQYNVYKASVDILFSFNGDKASFQSGGAVALLNLFGTNPIALDNISITSTFLAGAYPNAARSYVLYGKYPINNIYNLIPSGRQFIWVSYDMYYDSTQNVTFTAPSSAAQLFTFTMYTTTAEDVISDDNKLLNLIYKSLSGNAQQNDTIGSASDQAGALSDQIHEQEQTWYDQNSAAMEQVGLSSYRFTNQQASGILGVTTQFEQLWLSLGNWTLIYIFVLMLSLATFILRHEPSTRVKQLREQYNTDREVRLGWERINNPDKAHYRQLVERHRR